MRSGIRGRRTVPPTQQRSHPCRVPVDRLVHSALLYLPDLPQLHADPIARTFRLSWKSLGPLCPLRCVKKVFERPRSDLATALAAPPRLRSRIA